MLTLPIHLPCLETEMLRNICFFLMKKKTLCDKQKYFSLLTIIITVVTLHPGVCQRQTSFNSNPVINTDRTDYDV